MSIANKSAFPLNNDFNPEVAQGMTLLEYCAGLNWTPDEIESVVGTSVREAAAFLGIPESDYRPSMHYHKATAKARIMLARALIAELEKEAK